jgi:hypothetical protein
MLILSQLSLRKHAAGGTAIGKLEQEAQQEVEEDLRVDPEFVLPWMD